MLSQAQASRGWSWELHISEAKESGRSEDPGTEEEAGGTRVRKRTRKRGATRTEAPVPRGWAEVLSEGEEQWSE